MTKSELEYQGHLRTQVTHLRSGNQLITDAPTDNNGKGEAFSPTDLVAAGLLSCMVTVMGIHADKRGVHMGDVRGTVDKIMLSAPRRIGQLNIRIEFSNHSLSTPERQVLENIAINCPVARSLNPEIVQQVRFIYD